MAGHIQVDDSLKDEPSLRNLIISNVKERLLLSHKVTVSASSSLSLLSTTSSTTQPQNALITTAPAPLELRQNNPQDCSNLIAASVNRATVEISRTIIALNATFSQQLQQASISASNGIKSAQNSASSTIDVVVRSASVATVAAFSSVTVANLVATSATSALASVQQSASDAISSANQSIAAASSSLTVANLALNNAQATITSVSSGLSSISSASSSDVSRLSASLTLLEASVLSIQASASSAIAAAQSALASVTGSAAAQASSILASAASATQNAPGLQTILPNNGLPPIQSSPFISFTPGQAAAIVIGAVVGSLLLSLSVYFLIIKMRKKKERDSYLDEKNFPINQKKLPSRLSSASRTGNAMTIKYNPPKSSDAPPPTRSAFRVKNTATASSNDSERSIPPPGSAVTENKPEIASSPLAPSWPLTLDLAFPRDSPSKESLDMTLPTWPLNFDTTEKAPELTKETQVPQFPDKLKAVATDPVIPVQHQKTPTEQTSTVLKSEPVKETAWIDTEIFNEDNKVEKLIENPFLDAEDELPSVDLMSGALHTDEVSSEVIEEKAEPPHTDVPALVEPPINPFEEAPFELEPEPPMNPFEEVPFELEPEPTADNPIKPTSKRPDNIPPKSEEIEATDQRLDMTPEKLLPPQSTRVPSAKVLALLREEEPARTSTVPEIDTLLRIVAQQNENTADKPLFWSDFRPVDPEVEMAMSLTPLMDAFPPRNASYVPPEVSIRKSLEDLNPITQIQPTKSPLPYDIVVGEVNQAESFSPLPLPPVAFTVTKQQEPVRPPSPPPPPPLTPKEERELSPLRRNPQIRNIASLLAEREEIVISYTEEEEEEAQNVLKPNDREERGRSMVRTSDIIEARLSRISRVEETLKEEEEEQVQKDNERTVSPLRRNPITPVAAPPRTEETTTSPQQRNLSEATFVAKRKSRTVSPPRNALVSLNARDRTQSPLRRNPVDLDAVTSIRDRTRSPLRRNPSTVRTGDEKHKKSPLRLASNVAATQAPSSAIGVVPRPSSNAAFSQTLSKFRTLAAQNPNEGIIASTEVTQRAIAGIFIPGSLREQAVRNLSKSRERGKGADSMSRSASKSRDA